ncbi:hypothetical protein C8R47DRAFT_1083352 [Mycena vitilis]|nr:hypothetical protein C8R47DRAFT_1083352 [Mycena vitilis]
MSTRVVREPQTGRQDQLKETPRKSRVKTRVNDPSRDKDALKCGEAPLDSVHRVSRLTWSNALRRKASITSSSFWVSTTFTTKVRHRWKAGVNMDHKVWDGTDASLSKRITTSKGEALLSVREARSVSSEVLLSTYTAVQKTAVSWMTADQNVQTPQRSCLNSTYSATFDLCGSRDHPKIELHTSNGSKISFSDSYRAPDIRNKCLKYLYCPNKGDVAATFVADGRNIKRGALRSGTEGRRHVGDTSIYDTPFKRAVSLANRAAQQLTMAPFLAGFRSSRDIKPGPLRVTTNRELVHQYQDSRTGQPLNTVIVGILKAKIDRKNARSIFVLESPGSSSPILRDMFKKQIKILEELMVPDGPDNTTVCGAQD